MVIIVDAIRCRTRSERMTMVGKLKYCEWCGVVAVGVKVRRNFFGLGFLEVGMGAWLLISVRAPVFPSCCAVRELRREIGLA